ncbi:hypothetical protein IKF86_01795 [Candidatus Saccharibacteria bacterium]|nr:hypothetical protein [Candidatus Saccharibacteria bacterium]
MTLIHTKLNICRLYNTCVFALLISLLVLSLFGGSAFAENLDYEVNIQPSLVVTIPTNTVELDINPATAAFSSQDLSVSVGTNNPTGYTLTMSSESTSLMRNGGTETIPTLSPLDGGYTEDSFTENRWGYRLVSTNYLPFTQNIELDSNDSPTNSRTSTVTFGAKANIQQPSGEYQLEISFTAVANALPTPTMQTVSSWGGDVALNEEVTAIDTRDNNTYTVARLCVTRDANNNCTADQLWMTQNLNFAPSPAVTYTHANTDLGWTTGDSSATWTPRSDTMSSPAYITNFAIGSSTSLVGWTNDNSKPYYAEGKYYDTATSSFTSDEIIVYNGTKYQGSAACMEDHTASQCDHYKVGNYYNWSAAVASNDTSSITAQYAVAPNSVCPAGWRLPKGITNNGTSNVQSEFNAMLVANGVAQDSITESSTTAGGTDARYTANGLSLINSAPLYFVRSGALGDTTLYDFTGSGYYWSSTTVSGPDAYNLYYYWGAVYPAFRHTRFYGWSLRCVAR